MNIREKNKRMLINYFEQGSKKNCIEKLGVELEHLIVKQDTKESVSYYGEDGIEAILEELSLHYQNRFEKNEHLIGLYNNDYSISLEPAGQLEVSINPKEDIALIYKIYKMFLGLIQPILKRHSYELLTMGYQPKSCVTDLPLIPKKRYEFMDRYFKNSGICGINMMRGTAATQVSIDYCSEADFILKFRAAYMLMPLFEVLTDNSPIFEGVVYEGNMLRGYIWDNVDEKRTGIIPGLFEADFGFERYAEYLLKMPLIFIPNGGTPLYTNDKNAEEIWDDSLLSQDDIEHILSMSFLDIRLKNYIEIRGADSMPVEYVLGYLVLIKGIFYDRDNLKKITTKLTGSSEAIQKAKKSLSKDGFNGEAYGYNAAKLLSSLLDDAKNQLSGSEQILLKPLEEIIKSKRTLAREYNEKNIR